MSRTTRLDRTATVRELASRGDDFPTLPWHDAAYSGILHLAGRRAVEVLGNREGTVSICGAGSAEQRCV